MIAASTEMILVDIYEQELYAVIFDLSYGSSTPFGKFVIRFSCFVFLKDMKFNHAFDLKRTGKNLYFEEGWGGGESALKIIFFP